MARAYLTEFDATEEDFAAVAVKNHDNGVLIQKLTCKRKLLLMM